MRAMILAAGLGTRLRPLTEHTPKPMLEVAHRPLVGHQLASLATAGVSEVMINLHHLAEQIQAYVGDGSQFGVSVHYSYEPRLLETGGAIRSVLEFFEDQPFWLINGDIYSDFDFANLPKRLAAHTAQLVLTPTPTYREHGDFECSQGQITARGNSFVYCGISALHPSIVADSPQGEAFSLRDSFFRMIEERALYGQIHHGDWHDIGTLAQYRELANKFEGTRPN
ncbi:MAG: nucleotidyltransferase family protein [Pseudomonadota bacterium]